MIDRKGVEALRELLALRFTSGNSIPAERAHITAAEYAAIDKALRVYALWLDAPEGLASAASGSDGGTWLECDGLSTSQLDALNCQRVRLVPVGGGE